ncbi:MAG: DUF86 domain-containing protein [Pirellulales bacterium]|nr:DUF86 domain-containing protein [Pirellulales bacterium]
MFDREMVLSLLVQVREGLEKILKRTARLKTADDFIDTEEGEQIFDGICMQFMAVGENIKRIDCLTDGTLLADYPDADWTGAMGFRDIIAHQYFRLDPEEVFSIVKDDLKPLLSGIEKIIQKVE